MLAGVSRGGVLLRSATRTALVGGGSARLATQQQVFRLASTLVIAEHAGAKLSPSTLSTITAAVQLQQGGGITVLVAGKGVNPVAQQVQQVPGVGKVLVADDAAYERNLAENVCKAIVAAQKAGSKCK